MRFRSVAYFWWNSRSYYKTMGTKTTTNAGVVWGSHQSVATVCKNDGGNCRYDGCPGLDRNNKRRRSYPTRYQCLQCSIEKGYPVYLCNTTKKRADGTYFAVLCHMKYHEQQFGAVNAGDSSSDGEDWFKWAIDSDSDSVSFEKYSGK